MRYENILFDLDGTLTDSGVGITNSVIYALEKFNINVKDRGELYRFIGPPLIDSFINYYGFTRDEAKEAIKYYREYYKNKGIFENFLYDGIEDLIVKLKDKGKSLIVATTKPEVFARQILEHFNIANNFIFIAGSNLDGTRVDKYEIIKYALESCNLTNIEKTIMIGDRDYDIIGAKKIGIDSIGVLYGYGDKEELKKAGANFIANKTEDIENILLAGNHIKRFE